MGRLLVFLAAIAVSTPVLAANPVDGLWLTEGGWSKVRVGACPGRAELVCGSIVWLKKPTDRSGRPLLDRDNPSPRLRSRPLIGMPFITGFRRAGADRWVGGKIYDPDSGKTYDAKLTLNRDGSLKVEGCVLIICQAQRWTRAE